MPGSFTTRVNEVFESPWLDELRTIESVHDQAPAVPFAESRHFILTFHDSTMEAIARDIAVGERHESYASALSAMAATASEGL